MQPSNVFGLVAAVISLALIGIGLTNGRMPTSVSSVAPDRAHSPFWFWTVLLLYGFVALAGVVIFVRGLPV